MKEKNGAERTKDVDCRRRRRLPSPAPVFSTSSSLSHLRSSAPISQQQKTYSKTHNIKHQRLSKTVLENEYENKPIARPRY